MKTKMLTLLAVAGVAALLITGALQDQGIEDSPDPPAGAAASNGVVEDPPDSPYVRCSGHPFFVDELCTNESCVAPGLERRIFDEWKKQFMAIQQLSEEAFSKRILLSDVTISEAPEYVFWVADYVFVFDWIRSRQRTSIHLGNYPLAVEPDDTRIASLVSGSIREDRKYNIDSVRTVAEVSEAFESCAEDIEINWCHIDFENMAGRLLIKGSARIGEKNENTVPNPSDRPYNSLGATCVFTTVDAVSGEIIDCRREPCSIS